MKRFRTYLALLAATLFPGAAEAGAELSNAGFRPARVFSDNMVLQRDVPVPVWGWSDVDQTIEVEFNGRRAMVEARAGERWELRLAPMPALAEPALFRIRGSAGAREVVLANVVVGDVWLCMGQSNMEMIMGFESETNYRGILDHERELQDTEYPNLRLLNVPKSGAPAPAPDTAVQWVVSDARSAEFFSAVAYTFGRKLNRDTGVPIGLLHISMGGAPIERFMPVEALERLPDLHAAPLARAGQLRKKDEAAAARSGTTLGEVLADWERAVVAFCADAPAQEPSLEWVYRNYRMPAPSLPLGGGPGPMFHGMLAPIHPYALKGFVWYQGESNVSDGERYGEKLCSWIQFLRDTWRMGDLPFLAVELAPFHYHLHDWPMKGAAPDQRERLNRGIRTILRLPHTATVNTDDLTGDLDDIHPRDKRPVGERLAEKAMAVERQ